MKDKIEIRIAELEKMHGDFKKRHEQAMTVVKQSEQQMIAIEGAIGEFRNLIKEPEKETKTKE